MTKISFGKNADPKQSNKTDEGTSMEIDEILDTVDQLLDTDDADDLLLLNVTAITDTLLAPLAILTQEHFGIIESDTGWLDCDIIYKAQVLLQNINKNIDGFQHPTLGPVRNFDIISGEFIQILHTGNEHWIRVCNIGYTLGTVNIYDSLYNSVVENEIKEQISSMLGDVFKDIEVVPVQHQPNGCDCGIFATTFATCLVIQIKPESVQLINAPMRPHLLGCLKPSQMNLFPVAI